jgi:aspartate aminotransferase-like enzyme
MKFEEEVDVKLFTVGPVACYPEVLETMKQQMYSHRSAEYKQLHRETVELLQKFLETEAQVYLFSSTGTGFMEGAVRNCVHKKMLCCVNGSFGKRFTEVASLNGKLVETLEPPLGEPIIPDVLDDTLKKCPDVEAVAITHNETSAGLINPLSKLANVVKKHGKLLFVDAVSSMGGTEIKVDKWGLDVCFSSSQKCFGVPPGLGIGSVSEEALKKAEKVQNPGWYFNFKIWETYNKRDGTPMTSTIPQIAGINQILKTIDDMGGKNQFFEIYQKRNGTIRRGIQKLGLNTFPKTGYESPTLSCINAPKNINGIEIYETMREKGFELAKGYSSLKNTTFRIGNMGYIPVEDITAMLTALKEVQQDYGW